jgi:transcriptional regulator with XRE-family HTH domain
MEPNTTLIAARLSARMSQDDLAEALRTAGAPGACKRQVQRWEAGEVRAPWPSSARALERVFRAPVELLGFPGPTARGRAVPDGRGGHDVTMTGPEPARAPARAAGGEWSGIWESSYEYYSSSRGQMCASTPHHVLVLQYGDTLTVRSLPGCPSLITMDLTADGSVVTGTWSERTDPDGYYSGARYHGAIQMMVDPTGRRMSGKWLGFGRALEINSGPWDLTWRARSTTRATINQYSGTRG